jgi:hypothetical protein
MIVIGVDPGCRTGLAVSCHRSLVHCSTVDAENAAPALRFLVDRYKPDLVAIEIPGIHIHQRQGLSQHAMLKIARSVGQLQERAENLAAMCEKAGVKTRRCKPIKGGTKKSMPAEAWRVAYHWGTTRRLPSNHARDAAMLAHRIAVEEGILLCRP